MRYRPQRTIASPAQVTGRALFSSVPSTLQFLPADPGTGLQFLRTDLPGAQPIPATIDYVIPSDRRTAIEHDGVRVELLEHVLAALSGLAIDNCLIGVSAQECPGMDGSSLPFVEVLLEAGLVDQSEPINPIIVTHPLRVTSQDGRQSIDISPSSEESISYSYALDYGPGSPVAAQYSAITLAPEMFVREIAPSRTFVLESEVAALRAAGYGQHITTADLLVFGDAGVIGNTLRFMNECARHKLLDSIGDLALLGAPLMGSVDACRSGHKLNAEAVRVLRKTFARRVVTAPRRAA